ncbi:MAG: ABC transporter ATP-binding protein [Thermoplasmata archaeon]|nr:ABC transporter ATP-binding protein [Thermoplasmata archaeon]
MPDVSPEMQDIKSLEPKVVIQCEGLCKDFGSFRAVDNVDLCIRKGEIFGFLGPNGAGKTTTVRMLTTMERPSSGKVWIDGYDTDTQYLLARRNLGIIQQQNSLDKDISVRENIMHHALMQGMSLKDAREEMKGLCATMELTDRMDDLVENLSGGWKKRVSIVCSMIHHPDVLFLDEPTTGLDTQSRNLLWKMIRALNRQGTTIFLTTHYIYEAEALCDRIGMIDHGRIIAGGTPQELIDMFGRVVMIRTDDYDDQTVTFFPDRKTAMAAAGEYAGGFNTVIRKATLEDVYLRLTGGMS